MMWELNISFGSNGYCFIDDNTEFIDTSFCISEGKITVGKDCLFSSEVIIRNHDSHHIFDSRTHQRINYTKDIEIGNHVWIGNRATLLGGAKIGDGSVVGSNAVTSSRFKKNSIIAGVPAKIIRENVCWSRDSTDYFNRAVLEECTSTVALKYMS